MYRLLAGETDYEPLLPWNWAAEHPGSAFLSIVMFLILEPHGLAQLWRVAKEKLRLWPFPY